METMVIVESKLWTLKMNDDEQYLVIFADMNELLPQRLYLITENTGLVVVLYKQECASI